MVETSRSIVRFDAPPDNICILRLSALGDATHTVPVVRALQAAWPETKITWVIGKLEHKLLSRLPDIEFIVFDKNGGISAIGDLAAAMRKRQFDLLLHMQVSLRANLLSRLVHAPVKLGWNRSRSRDGHHWFTTHQVADVPFQHQVDGFLEFPRALGLEVGQPVWDLPVIDADRSWVREKVPPEQPLLLISPCSSHPLRNWSAERYAQVADYAAQTLNMQVVLTGGPSPLEQDMAEKIETHATCDVINLVGQDTLTQSMALMEHATVVLTPDSGPAHIASALGTPVVGLYAATWSRRSGPWRSLELCVDHYPEAARKFRGKEPEALRWGHRIEEPGVMELIEVDEVTEKVDQALAQKRTKH